MPTWNYAIAHLHGQLDTFDDEAGLAKVVDDLSVRHETRIGSDWRFEVERDELRRQLRGIVGFRFQVERMELKFKLSQNHPLANRENVATQLQAQDRDDSRAVAALMRERMQHTVADD